MSVQPLLSDGEAAPDPLLSPPAVSVITNDPGKRFLCWCQASPMKDLTFDMFLRALIWEMFSERVQYSRSPKLFQPLCCHFDS